MLELLLLALSGLGVAGGVVAIRAGDAARWRSTLEPLELRLPAGITPDSVSSLLRGIAGIVAPRLRRPFVVRAIGLEVRATSAGISHHLLVPSALTEVVVSSVRAALPAAVVRPDLDYKIATPVAAVELGLSATDRPLKVDNPSAVAASLLASTQPLAQDEEVLIQYILSPVGPTPAPKPTSTAPAGPRRLLANVSTPVRDREASRASQAKGEGALFEASVRLGAKAPSSKRAQQLLHRMTAAFHVANAAGVHLQRRSTASATVTHRVVQRHVPLFGFPCLFNEKELTGLLGIPTGDVELEGLSLGVSRLRPPSPEVPGEGLVLCRSNYPGQERPVAISWRAAMEHLAFIGPTGVGKSVALQNCAVQAMHAGHGLLVVDPHGDLAADIVAAIPSSRLGDLLWIAPTDDVVVGLNVLSGLKAMPELAADLVVNAIRHRWGGVSWGPQLEQLLWAGVVTLTLAGETLVELPRLYADEVYRRKVVAKIDDPFAAGPIWARYESWSEAEQARASSSVLNKTMVFSRPELRAMLAQRTSSVDFDAVLREGRIVVVSLPKGRLGRDAALTVAGLVLGAYWMAVMRRSGIPEAMRRPNVVILDEAHELFNLPTSVGLALAESRKYGVAWALAVQSIGQIPTKDGFRQEVLANTRTKQVWMTSAADAALLARELGPGVRPEDLQYLGRREVLVAPSVGGRTAPAITGTALPPPPATGLFDEAIAQSRQRYGRPRSEVEAELRQRHDERPPTDRVRRRRRT
jgi:DNA polymerase III delta prime subunit